MKKQNLRVWNVINPPRKSDYYNVESVKVAIKLINSLANRQLKNDNIFLPIDILNPKTIYCAPILLC